MVFQARPINYYKKKCCANIYINRQCLKKEMVPRYANIKAARSKECTQLFNRLIHNKDLMMMTL